MRSGKTSLDTLSWDTKEPELKVPTTSLSTAQASRTIASCPAMTRHRNCFSVAGS